MQYVLTFLEGFISFISPCMLPMLPVYVSYFAGSDSTDGKDGGYGKALGFVLGFSAVFCILGIFAGTVGKILSKYSVMVNIICGASVIVFGLSYLGVIKLNFFKGIKEKNEINGFLSAFVFGMIYSVSLTPCVGAFLGSALMTAASSGGIWKGFLMLLSYSAGLGIPFLVSALLIEKLEGAFAFIKKHYDIINNACGGFLILTGIIIVAGGMEKIM